MFSCVSCCCIAEVALAGPPAPFPLPGLELCAADMFCAGIIITAVFGSAWGISTGATGSLAGGVWVGGGVVAAGDDETGPTVIAAADATPWLVTAVADTVSEGVAFLCVADIFTLVTLTGTISSMVCLFVLAINAPQIQAYIINNHGG